MSAPCPTFAFLVEIEIDPERAPDGEGLWRELMAFVEQRGLLADGGRGHRLWTYRIHGEGMQATNADRVALENWLTKRPEVCIVQVGELFDLNSP
jgi:uncharacterized protein YggL (DUF469 family)